MRTPRAEIADALAGLIQGANLSAVNIPSGAAAFTYVSKHYVHWDAQDTTSWPVAYLRHMEEDISRQMYGTSKYHLHYRLFCFLVVNSADPNFDQDDEVINPLLDAIDEVLTPKIQGTAINLGLRGIDDCWIEGKTMIADGTDDGRAIIVIPITVSAAG